MMEVEDAVVAAARPAPTRERERERDDARPRAPRDAPQQSYQDRRPQQQQGRYQNGGGYGSGGGGYGGSSNAYDARDAQRDYGRSREQRDNGRGLYSDGMYRGGDRGYGRR